MDMNGRLISDEDMVGAEHMQTLDLFRMFDGDEGRYAGQYLLLFCILLMRKCKSAFAAICG